MWLEMAATIEGVVKGEGRGGWEFKAEVQSHFVSSLTAAKECYCCHILR